MVMVEVQNQLRPLIEKIDSHGKTLRSLYANGSGGPPGYLETARKEDLQVQKRLFEGLESIEAALKKSIDGLVNRIVPIEHFIIEHEVRDAEQRRRFKRYIAIWTIVLMIFAALVTLYDHRNAIAHSLMDAAPSTHSQLTAPQDAGIPPLRTR